MPTPALEYLFNEATSGQGPTSLIANVGGVNLPISYPSGSAPVWVNSGNNTGLDYPITSGNGPEITWSGTGPLFGLQKFTMELRLKIFGWAGSPRFGWQNQLIWYDGGLFSDVMSISRSAPSITSGAHVMHGVVDTTQASAANRVQIYVDGVLDTGSTGGNPGLNATMASMNGQKFAFGAASGQTVSGVTCYYWALYTSALSPTEVAANAAALNANDNVDPGSAPSGVSGIELFTRRRVMAPLMAT